MHCTRDHTLLQEQGLSVRPSQQLSCLFTAIYKDRCGCVTCSLAQPAETDPILRWIPLMRGSYAAFIKASFSCGTLSGGANLPPLCSGMSPSSCMTALTSKKTMARQPYSAGLCSYMRLSCVLYITRMMCNATHFRNQAFSEHQRKLGSLGRRCTRYADAGVTSITRTDPFLNLRQNGDRNSFKLVKNLRMVFGAVYVRLPMGRSCPSL